ncbi:MAG: F0F1 ATP synthase subunit gamma [Pantoea sp. Brub]|nr:F0F1 ATP synthase subunit gamma [Pantoea sp. Brub]
MVGVKEIRNKIDSIKNTQKITKVMEMVAASKMRKIQERISSNYPYNNIIHQVINNLIIGNLEYKHSYLQKRKINRVGYILISSDRGLCGSLNSNLFKKLLTDIKSFMDKGIYSDLSVIGNKGIAFLNTMKIKVISKICNIEDNFCLSKSFQLMQVMLQAYDDNHIDKLYIASNKFHSAISHIPQIFQLLPLVSIKTTKNLKKNHWDYIYEPDSKILLDALLRRYVKSQFYQYILENLVSEQAARMIAMKSATDNGGNLINDLNLLYNKFRQSSITQEIIEIVSGASAI